MRGFGFGTRFGSARLRRALSFLVPSYTGSIGGRNRPPNTTAGTANKQLMAQSHFIIDQAFNGVLEVDWLNGFIDATGGGITLLGAAATGRASIEYVDADGVTRIARLMDRVGGTGVCTAPDGGLFTFGATINARPCRALLRFWGNFPNGMPYHQSTADYGNGDILRYGGATADLTGASTSFADTWQGNRDAFLPVRIAGPTNRRTIGILGDSTASGLGDTANDAYGHQGGGARLLGRYLDYVNASVPGATAGWLAAHPEDIRYALVASCTDILLELGKNDICAQNKTAVQMIAMVQQIRANLPGKRVFLKTVTPWTNSSNVPTNNNAERQAYNTWVRSSAIGAGFAGFFDPCQGLENMATGAWANAGYTSDWVHETAAGNVAGATAAAAFDFAKLGSPTIFTIPTYSLSDLSAVKLKRWYRPTTATISAWPDSSPNGTSPFVQATPAAQPDLAASGGGLTFASASRYMDNVAMDAGVGAFAEACFVVFTVNDTNTNKRILSGLTGNGREYACGSNGYLVLNRQGLAQLSAAGPHATGKHIGYFGSAAVRADVQVAYDGGAAGSGTGTDASWAGTGIVTRMGGLGSITIHEVAICDVATITVAERQRIIGKLAWDHGIQANLPAGHPAKSAPPTAF